MRKALPLLAILASSVFFLAATPGSASAANCTYLNAGPTQHFSASTGNFRFGATVSGCTSVDQVRFQADAATNSGWYDATLGHQYGALYISGFATYPCPCYWIQGTPGNTQPGFSGTYSTFCWFIATEVHQLRTAFTYQIHNVATNTWGPQHLVFGTLDNVSGC